jgi:hypothetical protein
MNINTATDKDNGTDIDTYSDMDTDTKYIVTKKDTDVVRILGNQRQQGVKTLCCYE